MSEQCRRAYSTYIFSPAHGRESHLTFCSAILTCCTIARIGAFHCCKQSSHVHTDCHSSELSPSPYHHHPSLWSRHYYYYSCSTYLSDNHLTFKIRQPHGQSTNQSSNRRAPRQRQNLQSTYLKQKHLRCETSPCERHHSHSTAQNCSPD